MGISPVPYIYAFQVSLSITLKGLVNNLNFSCNSVHADIPHWTPNTHHYWRPPVTDFCMFSVNSHLAGGHIKKPYWVRSYLWLLAMSHLLNILHIALFQLELITRCRVLLASVLQHRLAFVEWFPP